ncbi:MAG: hypothetical protein C4523_05615, partial [Myxococcales bacterium]
MQDRRPTDLRDREADDDWEKTPTRSESVNYLIAALAAVMAATLARVYLGGRIGLGDAEAYYYAWSRHLDFSYYDHGPGIAYLIGLGTRWLGDTLLGVRVLSIAASAATALMIYLFGALLFSSRRTGLLATLLFVVSPVFFIGGAAAAPDAVFGLLWLVAAWFLFQAVQRNRPEPLVPMGIVVGLGLLCKYFMILFWPAALLYLLFGRGRRMLFSLHWVVGIIASLLIFSPVLYWNFGHDWASFLYHLSERHTDAALSSDRLLKFLAGQALYLSPPLALGLLLAIARSLGNMLQSRGRDAHLPFWLSAPVLGFFFLVGAWTPDSEPHWPLAGYLLLFPVLAHWLASLDDQLPGPLTKLVLLGPLAPLFRPSMKTLLLGWLIVPALLIDALLVLHLRTDLAYSRLPDAAIQPRLDISNELRGWDQAGEETVKLAGELGPGTFAASYHYTMCGQLAFAVKERLPVACLSRRTDAFDFFGEQDWRGKDAVFVTDNRY